MLTHFLRILALIMLIVAIFWFFDDRTYEPLLTLLGAFGSFIASFFVDEKQTPPTDGIHLDGVKSGGNIRMNNKGNGSITAKNMKAKKGVEATNER